MAKIYVKFNTAVIKEISLDKNEISFGRRSDNDIVIDHPTISGHHGILRRDKDHFVVEDLNSTNGTFINGRRIKNGVLKDRDQIGVAGHILDLYLDDSVQIAITPPIPSMHTTPTEDIVIIVPKEPTPNPKPPAKAQAPKAPSAVPRTSEPVPPPSPSTVSPTPVSFEPVKKPAETSKESDVVKLRIMSGAQEGLNELVLKEAITYIGTKAPAVIKIKGFLAPDLAAAITRKKDGYFLKAVKPGYAKVNGAAVQDQILLENGAILEIGSCYMIFVKTH